MYAQEKHPGNRAAGRGNVRPSQTDDALTAADLDRDTIHRWRKRLKDEPATAYELSVRIDNLSFLHHRIVGTLPIEERTAITKSASMPSAKVGLAPS